MRNIRTGIAAEALWWVSPRRLVAVLQRDNVVVVDPATGKTLRRTAIPGSPQIGSKSTYRAPSGLVVLLDEDEVGDEARQVYVAVVGPNGSVRAVALPGIESGLVRRGGRSGTLMPDFVVDVMGRHAFVFGTDRAAVVRLADLHVEERALPAAAVSDDVFAAFRRAVPVGDGLVALTGRGSTAEGEHPLGAVLLNIRDWSATRLDAGANAVAVAAGRVLAYGGGTGLRGYDSDGRRAYEVPTTEAVAKVKVAGNTAYLRTRTATLVVDARVGAVSRRLKPGPAIIDIVGCR